MPKPRIEKWLPRGRLGYTGIATAGATLVVSLLCEPKWALLICVVGAIVSFWFAVGLRFDHDADEAIDIVVMSESRGSRGFFRQVLCDAEYTSSRISSQFVLFALIGVAISVYRFFWG